MPAKSRFSTEQIVAFLNEVEAGTPVKTLCQEHGFSPASFYAWKVKYAPQDVAQTTSRLMQLESLRTGLERQLDASRNEANILRGLVRAMLRPVDQRRELVQYLKSTGLSERQALRIAGLSASSLRYQGKGKGGEVSRTDA